MSVQTTPDIQTAIRALLDDETSAGRSVSWKLGAPRPFLVYRLEGAAQTSTDTRVRRARFTFEAWGVRGDAGFSQSSQLIREVDRILFPPERVVHGFRGEVGTPNGDLFISNVERDVDFYPLADPVTSEYRHLLTATFTYSHMNP